jgi:hypothetical protein
MVPGSAWPGACNCPARCVRFRPGNGAAIPWCNYPPRGFRSEYVPCCIRPAVNLRMAGNHWPAYSQPLGELLPRLRRFRNVSGMVRDKWQKWRKWRIAGTYTGSNVLGSERCRYTSACGGSGGSGGLPEHIRMQQHARPRAVRCGSWRLPLAWRCITSQLRCPANSAASRSGVASRSRYASPRCVLPARYRLPGQASVLACNFLRRRSRCNRARHACIAGLSPVSLASAVSVFCSPNTVRKTSATSAGCLPVSRRRSPGSPTPEADVRGFPTQWPGAMSASRPAAP